MQRTGIFLSIALVAIAAAFFLNLSSKFNTEIANPILIQGDVEGMAVQYKGKLYTLNFRQQEQFIETINKSLPYIEKKVSNEGLNFDKLVVYRFQKPEIALTPIGYEAGRLVFSIPELHAGYLEEATPGKIQNLINEIVK